MCMLKIKKSEGCDEGDEYSLPRSRKPVGELTISICINLKQKVLWEIEKDGNPKHVIEKLVNEKYLDRINTENIDKS